MWLRTYVVLDDIYIRPYYTPALVVYAGRHEKGPALCGSLGANEGLPGGLSGIVNTTTEAL